MEDPTRLLRLRLPDIICALNQVWLRGHATYEGVNRWSENVLGENIGE